jgi:hypothetical protein
MALDRPHWTTRQAQASPGTPSRKARPKLVEPNNQWQEKIGLNASLISEGIWVGYQPPDVDFKLVAFVVAWKLRTEEWERPNLRPPPRADSRNDPGIHRSHLAETSFRIVLFCVYIFWSIKHTHIYTSGVGQDVLASDLEKNCRAVGYMVAKVRKRMASKSKPTREKDEPVFEMVVLGSGGGPLETDCSGRVTLWQLDSMLIQ